MSSIDLYLCLSRPTNSEQILVSDQETELGEQNKE